jgi:endonuclease-3
MNNSLDIIKILEEEYGNLGCALNYTTPYELLIATILSAQTTDETVNKATAELFKDYNKPHDIANLTQQELEGYIKICGLYKTKAKNIIEASKIIVEQFNGNVPNKMEDLIKLPGVGRKTANVVLSNAFGKDAIAVDTHVFRVANRLGLANAKDVLQTEKQLMENIPKSYWSRAHHWLIWHGRKICTARKPKCDLCKLRDFCKYFAENK